MVIATRHHRAALASLIALLTACAASAPDAGGGASDVSATAKQPIDAVSSAPARPASPSPSAKPASASRDQTPKRPVVTEYHGTRVTDDYQWLEDSKAPDVQAWIAAQNKLSRAHFDALPDREAIHKRFSDLITASSADRFSPIYAGGQLFALKFQPPKQQSFLVVMKSADDPGTERALVDPNQIDPTSKTSIDFYRVSRDGKKVAVSLSSSGTEDGTVHIYDVATGKETGDVIPRVNGGTAGGSVAWSADGKGIYYTRYPHEGERPSIDLNFYQQVYFHKLGAPVKEDVYEIGKELPRIAEVDLESSDDGKVTLASVENGDGGEYDHYLRDASGKWTAIAVIADKIKAVELGGDGNLYLLSLRDAPRGKIVRIARDASGAKKPDLAKAEVVVPESKVVIQSFKATKSRLYVQDLVGGPTQIRVFDTKGKALADVPILPVSTALQLTRLEGDDLLFRNQSYVEPAGWYRYRAATEKTTRTGLFVTSAASFADSEVVRETCTSKDGTKVPINILRRKGTKLDGSSPALLTGYGGYGLSQTPRFGLAPRVFLDQGGVYAVVNLRGGSEFGEEWHLAGNLAKKQNVFDDFAACGRYLVEAGYTKPDKLAIMGGSNGGLLMGAAVTQHPAMWRVVVSYVGIYDMLRYELSPNGNFNVTEFGTVKDPALFKALYAYSPYHNVKDGTAYPSTLFVTGANDPRVDPYNSRKMLARMTAASSSDKSILLRASAGMGHGGGKSLKDAIDENADVYAFMLSELGIQFKAAPPAEAPPAKAPPAK